MTAHTVSIPSRVTLSRFESLPAAPFYVGIILAGIATVIAGPILPVLSARWSLTDLQAGSLFTMQFAASTIGSVLSSHFRRYCVVLGYASIAAGFAALTLGGYAAALAAFALIGIGVGSAITATNLIFGTEYPNRRGALLAWVNFYWGVGAISCPQFVALAERTHSIQRLLWGLCFIALAVFAVFTPLLRSKKSGESFAQKQKQADEAINLPIFLLFSLLLFLYIGVETSIAGWTATYAHRFANLGPERSSLLVSAFWLSIVVGRVALSLLLKFFSELTMLFAALISAVVGILLLLLLSPHTLSANLGAIALCGFGCAPVFPLAVARLLSRVGRSRHSGWIFAICGSGGAVLPWLMGFVSVHTGSLRTAFSVPLAAIAGIMLLVLIERTIPRHSTDVSGPPA